MNIVIRNESEKDYRQVEELTREAFWNLYVPGCDEHYLAHIMRGHPDFVSSLAFVAILDEQLVGNIMYAKSHLINEKDERIDTITFGPVSVLPQFQNKGIGSALIRHSINKASGAGYRAIIIEGHPHNYCKHGFVGSKSLNISDAEGKYPFGLLALELEKGCLGKHSWNFFPSKIYLIDEKSAKEFDKQFPPREKEYRHTQEEFRLACKAFIE